MEIEGIQALSVPDVLPQPAGILGLINWMFAAETIQGRKLFKCGNFMRKYSSHSKVELVDEGKI